MMQKSEKSKDLAPGLGQSQKVLVQTVMGKFLSRNTEKSSEKGTGSKTRAEKPAANLPSKRRSKKRMWGNWAAKDTEEYRNRYPGKKDHPEKKDNLLFYTNQIKSKPEGDKIDDIHSKWFGDYELLERHHGYIQWLFPIRESGLNWHSQELQLHEIDAIMKDTKARKRILMSYKMMLDFYGMKLKDEETGEIERADNWRKRFRHLNRSFHNYLRITRILKCLGEFGYEHLEPPFVKFILQEGFVNETLDNLLESCERYWIGVIRDEKARDEIWNYYDSLYLQKYVEEADEQTDETEKTPAEQEQKPDEKRRKVQTIEGDSDCSDLDTIEIAMKLVSEETNDDDDMIEEKVAKTERKVHNLSESSDDSQEARYWQENDTNGNADEEMGIDLKENNEMDKGSDFSNDELVAESERNKEEVINARHETDDRDSEEVMDDQNNDTGSDKTTEMEKDIKHVDKINEVETDGNSQDTITEISGRRNEEKHISDKEDNGMIQEIDEHSKYRNTEDMETGVGKIRDKTCKDDDHEISNNTIKNNMMKADGTEAIESEINDIESDTNNAENGDVDSTLTSSGKEKKDSPVNVTTDETNQCPEKMNVTQDQEMNTVQISRATKASSEGEDIDVD